MPNVVLAIESLLLQACTTTTAAPVKYHFELKTAASAETMGSIITATTGKAMIWSKVFQFARYILTTMENSVDANGR